MTAVVMAAGRANKQEMSSIHPLPRAAVATADRMQWTRCHYKYYFVTLILQSSVQGEHDVRLRETRLNGWLLATRNSNVFVWECFNLYNTIRIHLSPHRCFMFAICTALITQSQIIWSQTHISLQPLIKLTFALDYRSRKQEIILSKHAQLKENHCHSNGGINVLK